MVTGLGIYSFQSVIENRNLSHPVRPQRDEDGEAENIK